MKYKFILLWLIASLMFNIHLSKNILAQDFSITEIKQTANNDLNKWLNSIPNGLIEKYGFNGKESFDSVRIGNPIPLFDYNSLTNTTKSKGLYLVPIIYKTGYACFLKVINDNKKYKVIGIGGKNYAANIYKSKIECGIDKNDISFSILQVPEIKEQYIFNNQNSNSILKNKFYRIKNENDYKTAQKNIELTTEYFDLESIQKKVNESVNLKTKENELD